MVTRTTPLERAFQLARSGECAGVQEIRSRLRDEGLDTHQLSGPLLMKQLRQLCAQSKPAADPPTEGPTESIAE